MTNSRPASRNSKRTSLHDAQGRILVSSREGCKDNPEAKTSMKFTLIVPSEFAEHYRQHKWEISGLLNWAKVLNGDLLQINEFAGGYDWILLNISSTEPEYISVVKQIDPDAKIVTVFD